MTNLTYEGIRKKTKLLMNTLPLSKDEINHVEKNLNIKFSNEFCVILEICSYEFIGNLDFYNFGLNNLNSVIFETMYLRKNSNLKDNYIILYQEADSAIFMNCQVDKEIVYYIAVEDIHNLIDEKPLKYEHQIFPSFVDFFKYLLDREEAEQQNTN